MAELIAAREASTLADLVELRLDGIVDLDVAGALKARRTPVVVTCRPTWEGGRFDGAEETRREILQTAIELGAEYVDVEWRAGFEPIVRSHASRVILSTHDFEGVPADLLDRARAMRAVGTALIKIAVMPSCLCDLLPLRQVGNGGDAVVIGMGHAGMPSRLLPARFGSAWSYAGQGGAPGQLPAVRMLREFRFRDVDDETALYGVVGNNVRHSLSPAMHNAAFAAAGMNAVYVPFFPSDFADFLTFADALDVRGASVTIPFKLDALRAATHSDGKSRTIGAANTLRRGPDGLSATNTDVDGFLAPLDALRVVLSGMRASVLGAGGSARAVVAGLVERGASVTVHARKPSQAEVLASAFGVHAGAWPVEAGSWDLLVNCTPAGSSAAPDESPMLEVPLDGRVVYDLTYRAPGQPEPPLVRAAKAAGCQTLEGLPMLIAQAERQFEWWTGVAAPAGVMAVALARRLGDVSAA